MLAVDYDRGVVGRSMQAAYQQLTSPEFFTLDFHSPEEYPTEKDMYHAVWTGKYWGAISATEGASDRLSAALQGGQAATTYNPADALHYIWNQQLYPAFSQSVVLAGMQQLVGATGGAYHGINGTQATQFVNRTDRAAIQALLNPIQATETNIKPAPFGASVLLNTVGSVTPILMQFFFLLVLNGASRDNHLFSRLTVESSLIARRVITLIYTFLAALCQTGWTWAFRETWDVNGNQFVLSWMTIWLLMYAQLLIIDTIMSVVSMPVMPFFIVAWVFMNIASTLSPFELQPGFYRIAYSYPGHNAYEILLTIWTGGASNYLYRNLPILFSWIVLGLVTSTIAHYRACHLAYNLERSESLQEKNVLPEPRDEEAGCSSDGDAISTATTMHKDDTDLERIRTAAEQQRQIYGPSIPPIGLAVTR